MGIKKPLINMLIEGIGKYIVTIPDMDDAKFERLATRLGKLAEAGAPAIKAAAEGLAAGAGKSIKGNL